MSLDDIQLAPSLAADLYKKTLVDIDNYQPATSASTNAVFPVLGNNGQKVCILVKEPEFPFLSDDDLQFLTGILTACKLSLQDVALINLNKCAALNYASLQEHLQPSVVLFFGTGPADAEFPLEFPAYQLQKYNQQTFLAAPSLQQLAENKEEKKKLWLCLKTLFTV